jgi:hypothetical protein
MHARHEEEGGETDVVLVAGREAPVPANTLEPLVQPVIDLFTYFSQSNLEPSVQPVLLTNTAVVAAERGSAGRVRE